jgi:hypothetical protein
MCVRARADDYSWTGGKKANLEGFISKGGTPITFSP